MVRPSYAGHEMLRQGIICRFKVINIPEVNHQALHVTGVCSVAQRLRSLDLQGANQVLEIWARFETLLP
jgi:hypothetical protein